tara:strand:+ start:156 stop:362 length:207 start_codon:yes stop_codon:yes gene_type:complete
MKKLDSIYVPVSIILAAIIISVSLSNINYAENKCFKEVYKLVYEKEIKSYSKRTANNNAAIMARRSCK